MDKKKLIEQIQQHLAQELAVLVQAAKAAHEAATHEDNKPENEYDTRGIEASYLAGAQAKRAGEIQQQLMMYKYLPVREYTDKDVICAGTLVEMELGKTKAFYFLVPAGGGMITRVDGQAVQVITANSPIGEAMLGRKVGDLVEVESRDSVREYRILSIR